MSEPIPRQLHVALRHPARVKVSDRSLQVVAFDATRKDVVDESGFATFHAVALYRAPTTSDKRSVIAMRIDLYITADNIASMVPQRFSNKP